MVWKNLRHQELVLIFFTLMLKGNSTGAVDGAVLNKSYHLLRVYKKSNTISFSQFKDKLFSSVFC